MTPAYSEQPIGLGWARFAGTLAVAFGALVAGALADRQMQLNAGAETVIGLVAATFILAAIAFRLLRRGDEVEAALTHQALAWAGIFAVLWSAIMRVLEYVEFGSGPGGALSILGLMIFGSVIMNQVLRFTTLR